MEMLLVQEGKAAVTDAAMKKVYDEAVKQQGNEQEVRARHILVPTEAEAKAILVEIKKGTDFAEMAKQKSKDPGAAAEGGDLGYFTKDQMVPEFAEQAFKMNKGDVSDPVKSQFGWHIIKVEDKRSKPAPAFEAVKEQVEQYRDAPGAGRIHHQAPRRLPRSSGSTRSNVITSRNIVSRRACPGDFVSVRTPRIFCDIPLDGGALMAAAVSPLAPKTVPDHAGDRRREACDRRGRHQVSRPHRRAARRARARAPPRPASSPNPSARPRRWNGAATS